LEYICCRKIYKKKQTVFYNTDFGFYLFLEIYLLQKNLQKANSVL